MIQLTKSEKIKLSTTEIAKRVRQQIKQEFKGCTFSVTSEYYSMGSSITIALMKADFKAVKDFSEIPEQAIIDYADNNGRSREQLKGMQEEKYHQLNQVTLKDDYNPLCWCNGVFLTEKGHNLLRRVVKIVDQYNYNDSDPQSDYCDVNFHLDLQLGKWDKPFIQEEKSLLKAIEEDDKQTEQELTEKAENGEVIRII